MKCLFLFFLVVPVLFSGHDAFAQSAVSMEELDRKYEQNWDKPEYAAANAAAAANYMSGKEQRVFYYLNLVRLNPSLFAATYVKDYWGAVGYQNSSDFNDKKRSLTEDLNRLSALPLLSPDSEMYVIARCQAEGIGKKGLVTHQRTETGCTKGFLAENASFGKLSALDIVMSFLIDSDVPNNGHRKTVLSAKYSQLGVAIAPHKKYGECSVLDFR